MGCQGWILPGPDIPATCQSHLLLVLARTPWGVRADIGRDARSYLHLQPAPRQRARSHEMGSRLICGSRLWGVPGQPQRAMAAPAANRLGGVGWPPAHAVVAARAVL